MVINLIGFVNSMSNNNYKIMARNTALRVYLSNEYIKTQFILKNIKIFTKHIYTKINQKLLSKYYDTCRYYYSASEEDKTLIETVISLCY